MLEAGGGEPFVRHQELGFVALFWRLDDLAAGSPAAERRVRLDRESVQRDVVGLERERALQISAPVAQERLREREDEIEREVGDPGRTQRPDRRARSCGTAWVRCIHSSTAGSNDCAPSETRFTPAPTHAAASSGVTSSGFASMVISAPAASATRSRTSSTTSTTPAPSRDGVPPPR